MATESEKIKFLRAEDYNPYKAAVRLAMYWMFRKKKFGERWLLPMNQTGAGALSMHDIAILRSGYAVFSHNARRNSHVGVVDTSRLPVLDEATERCGFYFASVLYTNTDANQGVDFLQVVNGAPRPRMKLQHDDWPIIGHALPIKIKSLKVLQTYEEGRQELIDFTSYQTARILGLSSGLDVERVAAGSAAANMELLEEKGIDREFLPLATGGKYDYGKFADWVRQRLSVEDIMASAPPVRNGELWSMTASAINKSTQKPPSSGGAALVVAACQKQKTVPEEERGAVYSKRYYHRKKYEVLALKDQCQLLRERNAILRRDNQRLEELVAKASKILAGMD